MSVGEAFLSAALGVLCDRIASLLVLPFFKSQQLNAPVEKLKDKLTIINRVLDDAEEKLHTDTSVKQWHDDLKDVVYDAEDLLDEIASKDEQSKIEAESQTITGKVQALVSSYNPFKRRKNEKLEKILETLEYLVNRKGELGLKDVTGGKPSYQRTPTTSIPDESVIYGRDDDKEAIMKWVLSDHPNISNPDVLAIVGHGGLGKTTLAQHVYRDSIVPDCFDMKAWVCVSEKFDVFEVTKDILNGFTVKFSESDKLEQIQRKLQDDLKEKKFLLVFDDFWSQDYFEWKNLLKPLEFGKEGSKILVTSRNQDVANCIMTSPIHQLQKLSGNDCWSLFEKHASMGTDMPSTHPDLEWIGKQIVEKCDGLPLAAKAIGGALRSKRDPEDWKNILESDMWDLAHDNILPVLKISYQFLPSELKRCFAYCAVFPKDCAFYKEQVIRLWMAEGLLTQYKGKKDIEQVGEDYFDGLVSRSFFQKSERKYTLRGLNCFLMRKCFLMHDLINDLAKSISGEFCFNGVDRSCEITGRIRHLRIDGWELGKHIFTIKRVRTILLTDWAIEEEVIDRLTTLTRLRVLCSASIYELPDAIDKLMHLRCLDLSNSTIQRLPDSVVSLWNLETLILFNCQELEELPAKISQLINLSQLDIRRTELTRMPPHMGKLKKPGELDYYIVGEESDCSIKELGPLERLRGRLLIGKLRNVSQVQESEEANLKGKEKLKELKLIWSDDEGSDDEGGDDEGGEVSSVHERSVLERSVHERSVLEQLQPHTNIEKLSIYGYAGRSFPDWVGDSPFSNMVELKLERCKYCDSLPALGQLGSLKRLSIMWFEEIKVVGPEFYGKGNKPPFGCLESLTFEEMPQWTEWVPYSNKDEGDGASAAFPLLQELVIKDCPNLIKTLPVDLPSLKKLTMSNLHEATRLDLGLALEEINIEECGNLKCLQPPHLPSLTKLRIKQCDSLESFPLDLGPVLEKIEIWDCKGLNCLSVAAELGHLESLQIGDCPNLMEIQLTRLPSLRRVLILYCQSLECFPSDLCPVLQQIEIRNCEELKYLSAAVTAEFGHLKSLKIQSCPKLEIPHTHLPSLTLLQIWGCDQLVSLPRAPALQQLKIAMITEGDRILRREACITGAFRDRNRASHTSLYFPLDLLRIIFPNLSHLELESCCEEVESFPPENVLLPPTLISLAIEDFPNLKSFDSTALQSLTCLQELRIRYCPALQSLPTQGLPSSLKRVQINGCPSLQVGQDWPFGLPHRW